MSEAKFTPGPWRLSFVSDGLGRSIWTDYGPPAHIADVTNGPANARLISAAPEMYEATAPFDHIGLDEELALMPDDTMATITVGAHTFCGITLGDFKNISAALAKARGDT